MKTFLSLLATVHTVVQMGKIMAISDTHFGYEKSNWEQFGYFLDVLKQGKLIARLYNKTEKQIKNIDKIILIGDIFDIWDPKSDKRINILRHSASPLRKLLEINAEIIYVTGNHDEEMEMYKDEEYLKGKIKIFGAYKEEKKEDNPSGIKKGYSYCFIHGHQFDKSFKFVGDFWRIPCLMASLNTLWQRIPSIRTFCIYMFPLIVLLVLSDRYVFNIYTSSLPSFLLTLSWIVAIPAYWTRYQRRLHTAISKISKKIRTAISKISKKLPIMVVVLESKKLQKIRFLKDFGEFLKEPSSLRTAKYKSIAELVSQGYYKKEIEPETDIIVFGHTHKPEHVIFYDDNLTPRKIFINTGSWVINKRNLYTLAYIDTDKDEHYLLKWDDTNKRLKEFFNVEHIKWSDGSHIHRQKLP